MATPTGPGTHTRRVFPFPLDREGLQVDQQIVDQQIRQRQRQSAIDNKHLGFDAPTYDVRVCIDGRERRGKPVLNKAAAHRDAWGPLLWGLQGGHVRELRLAALYLSPAARRRWH